MKPGYSILDWHYLSQLLVIMQYNKNHLLLKVLIVAFISTNQYDNLLTGVEAIKCYVCQSHVDPKCADPFDNLTLSITDCDGYPRQDLAIRADTDFVTESSIFPSLFSSQPAGPKPIRATVCRKMRQKVKGEWRTLRSCGYLIEPKDSFDGPVNTCKMRYGTHDIFMESCICDGKDGCNHATSTTNCPSSLNLFTISLVTIAFIFLKL